MSFRGIILLFSLFSLRTYGAQAVDNCAIVAQLLEHFPIEQLSAKLQKVDPWEYDQAKISLTPLHFLHPALASKLASKVGSLRAEVTRTDGDDYLGQKLGRGFHIKVMAGKVVVFEVKIAEIPGQPHRVIIENFGLNDPTNAVEARRDTQTETTGGKGFTLEQYRYAIRGIREVVRGKGYKEGITSGAESYLTAQLYLRTMKAKPASEKSQRTFDFLDKAYKFLRRQKDPQAPMESVEDFHNLIGTAVTTSVSPTEYQVVEDYQKSGKLPSGGRLLTDPTGEVNVLIFAKNEELYFVLLDPFATTVRPFEWKLALWDHRLELAIPLTE